MVHSSHLPGLLHYIVAASLPDPPPEAQVCLPTILDKPETRPWLLPVHPPEFAGLVIAPADTSLARGGHDLCEGRLSIPDLLPHGGKE